MAIEIFNRYEHKYKMDTETFHKVLEVMDQHMELDKHCQNHSFYTIANIYYDTPDNELIRRSLSKPVYKEKCDSAHTAFPIWKPKFSLKLRKSITAW